MLIASLVALITATAVAAPVAQASFQQRLPGVPLGQVAYQDQRRRQDNFAFRGGGALHRLRPSHQHLRELPLRYHVQPSRRRGRVQASQLLQCHESQSETYGASVHGLALAKGGKGFGHVHRLPRRAHDPAAYGPGFAAAFLSAAETCGACHDEAADDVEESVHGKAVAKGRREAATCIDCHSEHQIEALRAARR